MKKYLLPLILILLLVFTLIGNCAWLSGWDYRKSHTVNYAAGAGTDYQIKIIVHYGAGTDSVNDVYLDSHCRTDFRDIKFTDNDETTLLDYWMESKTDSDDAIFWIEVTDDLSTSNQMIYIYYGNTNATAANNIDNTFLFADDFNLKSDGGWTRWQTPVAIRYVGTYNKTYWGWVDKSGSIWIGSYDHQSQEYETFKLKDSLNYDDHAAPAILIRNDAKIVVFYTGHGDNTMYWRISTNAEDISAFDAEKNFAGGRDMVTYPQPIQLVGESNKVYLFFREKDDALGYSWVYRTSTDGCDTFSVASQDLLDFVYNPYAKPIQEGNKIHFLVTEYESPTSMFDVLYCYYYDGSFYKADGTKIGDVPGDLPFSKADLDMVYDSSEDGNLDSKGYDIAIDSSGNPVIVFTTLETDVAAYDIHKYRYSKWNGFSWNDYAITDEGTFICAANPSYSGGIALDKEDPSIVYLSKQNPTEWEIQKWTTADGGENWGTPVDITSSSTKKNIRPQTILNSHTDLPIFWAWGDYAGTTNWDTSIVSKSPETKWALRQGMVDFRQGNLNFLGTAETRGLIDGKTTIVQGAAIEARVKSDANDVLQNAHICALRKTEDWQQKVDALGSLDASKLAFQTRKDNVTTATDEIASDTFSSYHNYKVTWITDEAELYQGVTLKASHDTNIPTQDLVAVFYESNTVGYNAWIDWIFIRKFVDPEPANGIWGSEETPTGIVWNGVTITKWNGITITTPLNTQ